MQGEYARACVYVCVCVCVCVCVSMFQQGVIEGNLHLVEAEHQKALLPHQLTAIELQQKKYWSPISSMNICKCLIALH